MPTYDYRCEKCLSQFEVRASIAEYERGLTVKCPDCGSRRVRRTMNTVNILSCAPKNNSAAGQGCCGSGAGSGCCG
jgi:putative FmdB family regulatory protein